MPCYTGLLRVHLGKLCRGGHAAPPEPCSRLATVTAAVDTNNSPDAGGLVSAR